MNVSIIIPAYNEDKAIASVVQEINSEMASSGFNYEIIVVNDGSTDLTLEQAKQTKAEVIDHGINRGYGQSIITGMKNAKYDIVATMDADNSYAAGDLVKLLPNINKFDMVIGQRTGKEYKGKLFKYPARAAFRFLAEYISGVPVPDINSGLRIFRKSVYALLPKAHECKGFSFSTTTTLLFLAAGFSSHFVPIQYRHRSGVSKINYFRDTLRALQILLEIGIHFNPMKLILPMCAVPFSMAVVFVLIYLFNHEGLWFISSLLSFFMSMAIFGIGMILLQIKISGK
ncbi:MAG: glycosyltransferase family 2 protein [Elusimicrobia bacterium]|nr:glycosyltransferase family 2 protein [Elusimicrobiota bacterium]